MYIVNPGPGWDRGGRGHAPGDERTEPGVRAPGSVRSALRATEGAGARAAARVRQTGAMIEPGETAPDFTLPDQDGVDVTLSQLRGGPVVLYFYPKADTPGCTTQACGVRDHLPDYDAAGAT